MTATSRKWDSTPMWPKGQKVGQGDNLRSPLSPQCSQKIEGDSTLESSPMPGADIDIQNNMHSPLSMRSTKRQPKLWLFSFSNTERRIAIQDETPEVESHV
jgi:hypothetical protein